MSAYKLSYVYKCCPCKVIMHRSCITGSIDITTAKEIGLVDRDLYGLGHIIYIGRPDKTHWLSASLCDERSQWLLALRAYKYSDESKVYNTINLLICINLSFTIRSSSII